MASLEDQAFDGITRRLYGGAAKVLSAHPPSGKAYGTDLVRIPAKDRHAGRYHVDIIFLVDGLLFLTELKGRSSESQDDCEKLARILQDYDVAALVKILRIRVSRDDIDWESVSGAVPAIGVSIMDAAAPPDTVCIVASPEGTVRWQVGSALPGAPIIEAALVKAFGRPQ
jgi:hypothetical protein